MRDWQRSIECFLILGSGQASVLIVDTDVCPLYGEVYEKSISIVPFYEGQLQNRFLEKTLLVEIMYMNHIVF